MTLNAPAPGPATSFSGRLVSIGGGNMASAIILGGIDAGVLSPNQITVADPNPDRRSIFQQRGITTHQTATHALEHLDTADKPTLVLLAIKPQMLDAVATETRDAIARIASSSASSSSSSIQNQHDGFALVSILAGVKIQRLASAFALPASASIIRVMPNTPALVGQGMTAICTQNNNSNTNSTTDHRLAAVRTLFQALGDVVTLDESLMDAFTAVAGSGPAYLFLLAETLQHAAQQLGFDDATAHHIARKTITGSATLLNASTEPPGELRRRVTSPGGTTEAAIRSLEQSNFADIFTKAVTAARDRGRELSNINNT